MTKINIERYVVSHADKTHLLPYSDRKVQYFFNLLLYVIVGRKPVLLKHIILIVQEYKERGNISA